MTISKTHIVISSLIIFIFVGCYIPGGYDLVFGTFNVAYNFIDSFFIYPLAIMVGFTFAIPASLINSLFVIFASNFNWFDKTLNNLVLSVFAGVVYGSLTSIMFLPLNYPNPIFYLGGMDDFFQFFYGPCLVSSIVLFIYFYTRRGFIKRGIPYP